MKLVADWSELKVPCPWLEVEKLLQLIPRYNIAPTDPVVTITQNSHPTTRRWGLLPHWAKTPKGKPLINARAETVATKGVFKSSFVSRRCLIPASGFYEWTPGEGDIKRQPHLFQGPDKVLLLAGVHRDWRPPEGEVVPTCAVLTGPAVGTISEYHDRMPIIMRPEFLDEWLEPGTDPERLQELMFNSEYRLSATKVSPYVNNVKHSGPQCCEPVLGG